MIFEIINMLYKGGLQETKIKICAYMTMGWWIIISVHTKPCWQHSYRTTSQITGFRKFFHASVQVLIFVIIVLLLRSCSFSEFFLWPIWYAECPYCFPNQFPIQLLFIPKEFNILEIYDSNVKNMSSFLWTESMHMI